MIGVDAIEALAGIPVKVSPVLPLPPPDFLEDITRYVRHGFKDVLAWLGEDVGPPPGERTHVMVAGGTMFVSPEVARVLSEKAGQS